MKWWKWGMRTVRGRVEKELYEAEMDLLTAYGNLETAQSNAQVSIETATAHVELYEMKKARLEQTLRELVGPSEAVGQIEPATFGSVLAGASQPAEGLAPRGSH